MLSAQLPFDITILASHLEAHSVLGKGARPCDILLLWVVESGPLLLGPYPFALTSDCDRDSRPHKLTLIGATRNSPAAGTLLPGRPQEPSLRA